MRAEKARRRLSDFVKWAWPVLEPTTPLKWGWHLDAICEHLQAVSERQIRNLLVNTPAGCLKSTVFAVCWPAWHWIEWPSERFVTASYKMSLATRDATRSRRVIESRQYREAWGDRFKLTTDQNAKERYENDRTGVRLTTSVGGGTGDRGQFTLLDDPHNVEEAESAAVLESTRRWHDEAFWDRINDPEQGGRVVVGHRVGPRDLSGHLIGTGLWTHLRLPEEYDPKKQCVVPELKWQDPRKEEGELLRPGTMGPKQVAEAKKALGPFAWAAKGNQDPVPREGALYKLWWFAGRRFRVQGDWYVLSGGLHVLKKDCRHFAVCDPAGGTSESACHTATGFFAVTPANDLLLLLMLREKIDLEQIVPHLHTECDRWPDLLFLGLEDGFLQKKLIEQAKRRPGMPPIRSLKTQGKDKLARSIPALTRAQEGQIWLPEDGQTPWLEGFALRLAAFTGQDDADSDEADVLAYGAQEAQRLEKMQAGFAPRASGGLNQ